MRGKVPEGRMGASGRVSCARCCSCVDALRASEAGPTQPPPQAGEGPFHLRGGERVSSRMRPSPHAAEGARRADGGERTSELRSRLSVRGCVTCFGGGPHPASPAGGGGAVSCCGVGMSSSPHASFPRVRGKVPEGRMGVSGRVSCARCCSCVDARRPHPASPAGGGGAVSCCGAGNEFLPACVLPPRAGEGARRADGGERKSELRSLLFVCGCVTCFGGGPHPASPAGGGGAVSCCGAGNEFLPRLRPSPACGGRCPKGGWGRAGE